MLLLLNEHGDLPLLFPNLSSYNINNQLAKFEKNVSVHVGPIQWNGLVIDLDVRWPLFFFAETEWMILFTIISTLSNNEQKINVGILKSFKISLHGTSNPAILRLQRVWNYGH